MALFFRSSEGEQIRHGRAVALVEPQVRLKLTIQEAQELLSLCLQSMEAEGEPGVEAMRKLARALASEDVAF